jgi:N-acetyl-anhydromuramyl-L-alanine amidase AmpD
VFLPGESGVSSWRVRYFFLESPVFLPGESGVFASAHFCIRHDGKIVQLVWERNRAWYARSSGTDLAINSATHGWNLRGR